jgi:methionyl-tRNA formyltransferase
MRILFLGNNWVGWQLVRWLREQRENIVGLVVHPAHQQKHREEIIASAGVEADAIFDGARLQEPETLSAIQRLEPDIAVSVFFGYILRPSLLRLPPAGCINLHPSLLPYNRGAHPNVWSIIEGTPAGVTLHYIDAGVDTGDIIAQRQVEIEPVDTAETLYHRLEQACIHVFSSAWPLVRAGKAPRIKQPSCAGTCHRARDVERIDEIDPEASYKAKDLIDLLRARTFPPHSGAYFRSGGRKVYLRLQLAYEDPRPGASLDRRD